MTYGLHREYSGGYFEGKQDYLLNVFEGIVAIVRECNTAVILERGRI